MKKLIFGLVATVMSMLFMLTISCSENDTESFASEKDIVNKYQNDLSTFYKNASSNISLNNNIDLKTIFSSSYIKLFSNKEGLENLNKGFNNYRSFERKRSTFVENKISEIINNSLSEKEAIASFQTLIEDSKTTLEDKIDFISIRETIIFISNNEDYVHSKINTSNASNKMYAKCSGWWSCWGKCVAGTLGGAITGGATLGLAGAAVGTVVLPVVGTVSAGTVGAVTGAVGGGLAGAAASCN
jgi:hypothetical protein